MIALEPQPRNRLLLRMLYATAVRVSELCRMHWDDLQAREVGGQVTIVGKGGKTNCVLIPEHLWRDLMEFRKQAIGGAPIFAGRKGKSLHPGHVLRIVRKAAKRAGIDRNVSPHWLRHSHASHALDRGAPIHLVQATLNHSNLATTGKYLHVRPSDCSSRYLEV